MKDFLKDELKSKVREALLLRDWKQMEHWAKQWVLLDPQNSIGFKWWARSLLAQNKIQKAAYAYSRLLDFDPGNEEATKFFQDYPSENTQKKPTQKESSVPGDGLSEKDRTRLSEAELHLAQVYESAHLFLEAAQHYSRSFDWQANQLAAENKARCLHRAHQGLEAIRFLRKQLLDHPSWIRGRMLLGRILYELGYLGDAQREWQRVLKQEPQNHEALRFLQSLH